MACPLPSRAAIKIIRHFLCCIVHHSSTEWNALRHEQFLHVTVGVGFAFCTLLLFQQRPFCLRWGQHFVFSCRPMCLGRTGCQYHCNAHDCLERLTAERTYCVVTGENDISHDIIAIRDANVTLVAQNLLIIVRCIELNLKPHSYLIQDLFCMDQLIILLLINKHLHMMMWYDR